MYRILIADDEGIMLESLKAMILKNFENCEVQTVKTGRTAIEQAEYYHPDIIFMDIQMPGINGIAALKEIRGFNTTALFYIISAYDKFDYAKEAIDLGVERYLMKPITKSTVIEVVTEAQKKVDEMRRKRSDQLKVQEKLETIIPVVENGFISNMLIGRDWQETSYFKQLLDISENYAYVLLFQFGTSLAGGRLVSPVGASIEAQNFYPEFRAVVKSFIRCVIGGQMSDCIAVAVPHGESSLTYEERIAVIERARNIASRLEERLDLKFRAGIGKVHPLEDLRVSYREADRALQESSSRVVHTDDVVNRGEYEGEFPSDVEKSMFQMLAKGDTEGTRQMANRFFDWMIIHYPESENNIRLKVLEFVLQAEKDAFREGAVNYGFTFRENYLSEVMETSNYEQLRAWFLDKMLGVCRSIHDRRDEQSESVVTRAKTYIQAHYDSDISLDDVSREVNVSPYYFSKLFKEEAGENFIEYLTRLRIERAKDMLQGTDASIKEISMKVGYADPNYFSRLFKKQTEMTPREYRDAQR